MIGNQSRGTSKKRRLAVSGSCLLAISLIYSSIAMTAASPVPPSGLVSGVVQRATTASDEAKGKSDPAILGQDEATRQGDPPSGATPAGTAEAPPAAARAALGQAASRFMPGADAPPTGLSWMGSGWVLNYGKISKNVSTWLEESKAAESDGTGGVPASGTLLTVSGSLAFPLTAGSYRITQAFGCVPLNTGYAQLASCPADRPSFHDGIDFGATAGTQIYAVASGIVTFAGLDSASLSANSKIVIQHDGDQAAYRTEYLHWQKTFVKSGDHVQAGQVIAEIGSIGYSTGPHLHFAVKLAATGAAVDPLLWLQGSTPTAGPIMTAPQAPNPGVIYWDALIREAGQRRNVPIALIAAIMTVESGGNPEAISPAGAQGLMQVMPYHLTRYGVSPEMWRDPAMNIDSGARYLAESLSTGASLEQATARYFGEGCDVLGTCTGQYVQLVMGWYAYYAAWFDGQPLPPSPMPTIPLADPTVIGPPSPDGADATPTEQPAPVMEIDESQVSTDEHQQPGEATPEPGTAATPGATPAPSPATEATPTTPSAPSETNGSATPTPTPSPSPSASPTATATPTPTATPEATPAGTASPTATGTATGTATATASPTPTATPTPVLGISATPTPSPTPTQEPEPTPASESASGTPTATPSPTPTPAEDEIDLTPIEQLLEDALKQLSPPGR